MSLSFSALEDTEEAHVGEPATERNKMQLISALKVSENTPEIKLHLLPAKTKLHTWHQHPDLKSPQLKISKSSNQQS